jgi:hypothetical protein
MNGGSNMTDDNLQVLLASYQAAIMSRDHYDSVRWTIGSVFIGAELATYGISFLSTLGLAEITALAIFSEALLAIFVLYDQLVQPYIDLSFMVCREIEERLKTKYDFPALHTEITERTWNELTEKSKRTDKLRGKYVFDAFILIIMLSWVVRVVIGNAYGNWALPSTCDPLIAGIVIFLFGMAIFLYRQQYPHGVDVKTRLNWARSNAS